MIRGRFSFLVVLWGVGLLTLLQTGCLRRRMTIRSNPPGALCYIDNYEIGVTPCSTSFLYYGTREVRLVRDGYETLVQKVTVPPPWYEIPPLDFFSENLTPFEVRDERTFNFTLTPQVIVPTEQLLDRAEGLRRSAQPPAAGGPLAAGPSAAPVFQGPPVEVGPETIPPGGQPIEPLPVPR